MKRTNKKLAVGLMSFALVATCGTGVAMISTNAETTNGIAFQFGASVRVAGRVIDGSEQVTPAIRFSLDIDESIVESIGTTKEVGMIIVPETYITDYKNYVNGFVATEEQTQAKDYYDYFTTESKCISFVYDSQDEIATVDKDGKLVDPETTTEYTYTVRGAVDQVSVLTREYVAIGYVANLDGTNKAYAEEMSTARSVAYVSAAAINAGETADILPINVQKAAYEVLGAEYSETNAFEGEAFNLAKSEVNVLEGDTVELSTDTLREFAVKYTSSDNTVATVDKTGKVTTLKPGSVTITAKIGDFYERTCTIEVAQKPVELETATDVDMSVDTYAFVALPDAHTVTSDSLVKVAGTEVAFVVEGNTLKIAVADLKALNLLGEQAIEIKTATTEYVGEVVLITKILYTAADLETMINMIYASGVADGTTMTVPGDCWGSGTYNRYKFYGYFVLGANIKYTAGAGTGAAAGNADGAFDGVGAFPPQTFGAGSDAAYYNPDYGFTGTFDGRGYTISDLTFTHDWKDGYGYTASIFGQLSSTAVIKNVRFDNVTVGSMMGSIIAHINAGTIENVSVTGVTTDYWCDQWTSSYKGILVGTNQGGTIRNVVVSIKSLVVPQYGGNGYGLLVGAFGGNGQTRVGTIENVFVVFEQEQAINLNQDSNNWYTLGVAGGEGSISNALKELESTNNIKVFTYGETFTGKTESFENEYWTVEEGQVPVFKTQANPEYVWNVTVVMQEGTSEDDITAEVLGDTASGVAPYGTVIDIAEIVEEMLQAPQYEGCYLVASESILSGTVSRNGLALKVVVRKIEQVELKNAADVDMSVEATTTIALPENHGVTANSSVKVAGNAVAFTVEGNNVIIANANLKALGLTGEQVIEITNDAKSTCFVGKVVLITKILYTAADLETMVNMIYASGVADGTTMTVPGDCWGAGTYYRYKFYGYFVLGANIKYTAGAGTGAAGGNADGAFDGIGAFPPQTFGAGSDAAYYNPDYGFTGTFDGRGYTISDLTFTHDWKDGYGYTASIFGQLASTAVIKNVRFDNVTVGGQMGAIIAHVNAGTIENVSVTGVTTDYWCDQWTGTFKGILVGTNQGGTIRNVVVSIKSLAVPQYDGNGYGLLVGAFGGENQTRVGTIENVFVVFEQAQAITLSADYSNWYTLGVVSWKGSISNALKDLESTNNINVFTYGETFTGNTESFENEYWTVEEGKVPTFVEKA